MVVLVRVNAWARFPAHACCSWLCQLTFQVIYPVFMTTAKKSVQLAITPAVGGEKRTVHIRPTQLPFVNAIASTVYKVHGETLTSLVVADWYAKSKPAGS